MSDKIGPASLARLLDAARLAGRDGLSLPDVQACIGQDASGGQVGKDKGRHAANALIHVALMGRRPHHAFGKTYDRYVALAPVADEVALLEQAFAHYTALRARQNRRASERRDL